MREYADIVERLDRDYTQLRSSVINAKDLDKLKRDLYKIHVCPPNVKSKTTVFTDRIDNRIKSVMNMFFSRLVLARLVSHITSPPQFNHYIELIFVLLAMHCCVLQN